MSDYDFPATVPAVLDAARQRIAQYGVQADDAGSRTHGYALDGAVMDVLGLVDPFGGEVYDVTPRGRAILALADEALVLLAATAGKPGLKPRKAMVVLMELSGEYARQGGARRQPGQIAALRLFDKAIAALNTKQVAA